MSPVRLSPAFIDTVRYATHVRDEEVHREALALWFLIHPHPHPDPDQRARVPEIAARLARLLRALPVLGDPTLPGLDRMAEVLERETSVTSP